MSSKRANKRRQSRKNRRGSRRNANANAQQVQQAMSWFVQKGSFDRLSAHGNTSWSPSALIIHALLWVWSDAEKLTDAFDDSRDQSHKLFGKAALTTYQGLAGALQTWTAMFMPMLQRRAHQLMQQIGGKHLRVGKWCAIGMDGSRTSTPRTVSNEDAFCAKNYGAGKTAKYRKKKTKGMRRKRIEQAKPQPQGPQIWVTLMWQIGLGLPWCWKLGPSSASERQHAMDMIENGHFLKNTLFVGDAGFVGYDLWKHILAHGHNFMVRVGGNVSLLEGLEVSVGKRQGKTRIVYCWPRTAMNRKLEPLKLRLVQVKLGRKKAWLLTSVLDEEELSPREMLRLYELRWGVELGFRALKQTFKCRKLRSRNSQRALNELEWSLLGMTVIELFALKHQLRRPNADPKKLSFAESLRATRRSLKHLHDRPPYLSDFESLLAEAVTDEYERKHSKEARYKPKMKDKPSCGEPVVAVASLEHKRRLKKLREMELKHAA